MADPDALTTLKLNPYSAPILAEAKQRRISIRPIPECGPGFFQLTFAGRTVRFNQAQFDGAVSGVTQRVLYNKASALVLIQELGLPIAPFRLCHTLQDAHQALAHWGEVVVKPTTGSGGLLVRAGLTRRAQVAKAFTAIVGAGRVAMVQQHLPGTDNRVLLVGKQRAFCVQREPAYMVGDGERSLAELIAAWNQSIPVRNRRIRATPSLARCLSQQGFGIRDVPPKGAHVQVGELANSHQGGFASDVTETACPEAVEITKRICEHFDCNYLGVDFLSEDFSAEPGKIIEVNPHAGITLHHQPSFGPPRDVASAILDFVFPNSR